MDPRPEQYKRMMEVYELNCKLSVGDIVYKNDEVEVFQGDYEGMSTVGTDDVEFFAPREKEKSLSYQSMVVHPQQHLMYLGVQSVFPDTDYWALTFLDLSTQTKIYLDLVDDRKCAGLFTFVSKIKNHE